MCVEGGDGEPSKFVEIVQIRKTFCGQRDIEALLDRFRRDNLKNERFLANLPRLID